MGVDSGDVRGLCGVLVVDCVVRVVGTPVSFVAVVTTGQTHSSKCTPVGWLLGGGKLQRYLLTPATTGPASDATAIEACR